MHDAIDVTFKGLLLNCGFLHILVFNVWSIYNWNLFMVIVSEDSSYQNNVAMELINSVTGVDEEGRSRQKILTYAARRYAPFLSLYFYGY